MSSSAVCSIFKIFYHFQERFLIIRKGALNTKKLQYKMIYGPINILNNNNPPSHHNPKLVLLLRQVENVQ